LEAKVVVHFGPRLEHYVRVPLHNKVGQSAGLVGLLVMDGCADVWVAMPCTPYLTAPLVSPSFTKQYKESELSQLSGWHASSAGEETETPEVRDVTGAPQVRI
jgi:hypothetical protein